ncbi:10992_t:CDS:2 [Funneliformis geosporum]|uniref:10992_t:CDS:1 n=1 Tax=Funneliformis geosporum TaxID=1117311 RepID=A0A9W4SN77_9GLOM|nr:10992_t:CDS:2 [Funneliformis geosporum]
MDKREQSQRFNNDVSEIMPKIKILLQNDEFLVIDKPYDVRIDGDTSKGHTGCYCLALTKKSAGIASVAFAKRKVDKYYLAIVRGWLKNDSYVVEQPIAEVPNNRYRMSIGTDGNPGKSAKTEIKVLLTLVSLHPITGRRHQLRLHCQFLNHPIVGDWHYERQIMNYTDTWRMMLHAQKLVIPLYKNDEEKGRILDVDAGDPFSELVVEDLRNNVVEN